MINPIKELKQLKKNLTPNRENLKPFLVSATIAALFLIGYYYLGNHFGIVMMYITLILLVLMVALIGLVAEFMVLKSLFFVAAELSLLIFLAQSYCDVQGRTIPGDQALKNLLVFGLVYIGFTFCRSLYKALHEHYKVMKDDPWSKEKIGTITLFLIFTGMFIWQIYLIMNPIVLDLCVYR